MWTRQSLKADAKTTMKTCFGSSILVCLIEGFVTGIGSSSSSNINVDNLSPSQALVFLTAFLMKKAQNILMRHLHLLKNVINTALSLK